MSAFHLQGVILPTGEARDVYVVGATITFEPQHDALTLIERGYLIPGLFDAHRTWR